MTLLIQLQGCPAQAGSTFTSAGWGIAANAGWRWNEATSPIRSRDSSSRGRCLASQAAWAQGFRLLGAMQAEGEVS